MRQSFFSIASAVIFAGGGLLFAFLAHNEVPIPIGRISLGANVIWMIVGLFFIMAYFSLVHMQGKKK